MSEASKGRKASEETRTKMSIRVSGAGNPSYGTHQSESAKNKHSLFIKGLWKNPAYRNNQIAKQKLRWADPLYKMKQLHGMLSSGGQHPNKSELFLLSILESMFPGEYRYVGNGTLIINGRNPDYCNINGQKKLIEFFGDYWHGEKKTGRDRKTEEAERISCFSPFGYKTMIVWGIELKDGKTLRDKLLEFHHSP